MTVFKRYFKCGCIDEIADDKHYIEKLCVYHKKKGKIIGRNLQIIRIEPITLTRKCN